MPYRSVVVNGAVDKEGATVASDLSGFLPSWSNSASVAALAAAVVSDVAVVVVVVVVAAVAGVGIIVKVDSNNRSKIG